MTADAPESLANPRLWLAFATMLFVGGIGNTFPVLFPALLQEFGGARAAIALAVTLMWIGGGLLGPVAGFLVDRTSPRAIVVTGLIAAAIGLALAALAPTLTVFTLAFGVGVGIGAGLTGMVPQAAVIATTYRRRRGFATGIAFAGSMAGYFMATPAHWAIETVGWRATLGAYVAVVLALVPCVWRAYPRSLGVTVMPALTTGSIGHLARTVSFWALAVTAAIGPAVGYLATVLHALYFASLGYSAWEASAMLMIGGVLSTTGRAFAGLAADRFGAPVAGFLSYGLSLVGTLCLLGLEVAPARAFAYGYLFFIFLPLGTRAPIVSLLVARIAPPARFGSVFGWLTVGNSLGAALGPLAAGGLYDLYHSYTVIYAVAATLVVVALISLTVFVRTAPAPR
jgi:MFS family permease